MASKVTKNTLVAEICLYGTQQIGAGYLVRTKDGRMMGDGEPREGRSMTEAIWLACQDVRKVGIEKGKVRVFAPSGRLMADTDLNLPGYFGNLTWQTAPVYTINAEDIEAAVVKDY